jgi:hypothetical protein
MRRFSSVGRKAIGLGLIGVAAAFGLWGGLWGELSVRAAEGEEAGDAIAPSLTPAATDPVPGLAFTTYQQANFAIDHPRIWQVEVTETEAGVSLGVDSGGDRIETTIAFVEAPPSEVFGQAFADLQTSEQASLLRYRPVRVDGQSGIRLWVLGAETDELPDQLITYLGTADNQTIVLKSRYRAEEDDTDEDGTAQALMDIVLNAVHDSFRQLNGN